MSNFFDKVRLGTHEIGIAAQKLRVQLGTEVNDYVYSDGSAVYIGQGSSGTTKIVSTSLGENNPIAKFEFGEIKLGTHGQVVINDSDGLSVMFGTTGAKTANFSRSGYITLGTQVKQTFDGNIRIADQYITYAEFGYSLSKIATGSSSIELNGANINIGSNIFVDAFSGNVNILSSGTGTITIGNTDANVQIKGKSIEEWCSGGSGGSGGGSNIIDCNGLVTVDYDHNNTITFSDGAKAKIKAAVRDGSIYNSTIILDDMFRGSVVAVTIDAIITYVTIGVDFFGTPVLKSLEIM